MARKLLKFYKAYSDNIGIFDDVSCDSCIDFSGAEDDLCLCKVLTVQTPKTDYFSLPGTLLYFSLPDTRIRKKEILVFRKIWGTY